MFVQSGWKTMKIQTPERVEGLPLKPMGYNDRMEQNGNNERNNKETQLYQTAH